MLLRLLHVVEITSLCYCSHMLFIMDLGMTIVSHLVKRSTCSIVADYVQAAVMFILKGYSWRHDQVALGIRQRC